MISRRRLTTLAVAASSLAVIACGAAQGDTGPQASIAVGESGALEGIGETPEQQLDDVIVLPTAPGPTEVEAPQVSILVEPSIRPEITDDRVFLVGDSVMQALAIGDPDPLDLYVGSLGWTMTVDAVTGRFTDEGVDVLRDRKDEVHQVLVAMLGNNYDGNELAYAGDVSDMLEMFPDVRMLVMFTVPLYDDKQAEVNSALRTLAEQDKRLVLIDWEAATRTFSGSLRSDDVHPSAFGTDVLAQMIGVVLGRSPDGDPTVPLPVVGSSDKPRLPPGTKTNKDEDNSTPRPGGNSDPTVAPPTTAKSTPTPTKAPPSTTRPPTGAPTTTRPAGPSTTNPYGPSTAPPTPTTAPTTAPRPATTVPSRTDPPPTDPPPSDPPPSDPPPSEPPRT